VCCKHVFGPLTPPSRRIQSIRSSPHDDLPQNSTLETLRGHHSHHKNAHPSENLMHNAWLSYPTWRSMPAGAMRPERKSLPSPRHQTKGTTRMVLEMMKFLLFKRQDQSRRIQRKPEGPFRDSPSLHEMYEVQVSSSQHWANLVFVIVRRRI
jgi:hypothetical protein